MILAQAVANQWLFGIAACSMLGTLGTGILTLIGQRKANTVAVTTAAATTAKLNEVHVLVNSRLGTVMNNYASTMAALAKTTGDPLHAALAASAAQAAQDHAGQQLVVDAAAAAKADAAKR